MKADQFRGSHEIQADSIIFHIYALGEIIPVVSGEFQQISHIGKIRGLSDKFIDLKPATLFTSLSTITWGSISSGFASSWLFITPNPKAPKLLAHHWHYGYPNSTYVPAKMCYIYTKHVNSYREKRFRNTNHFTNHKTRNLWLPSIEFIIQSLPLTLDGII